MSVAKTIEISAESDQSLEGAIENGIRHASRTVENIESAWVKEQKVLVENGQVAGYRVTLKITFVLKA